METQFLKFKIPSILGTSENHLGPSLDYMLDAKKLPSQTLEALFSELSSGIYCRVK
jgi:hypothetical protein